MNIFKYSDFGTVYDTIYEKVKNTAEFFKFCVRHSYLVGLEKSITNFDKTVESCAATFRKCWTYLLVFLLLLKQDFKSSISVSKMVVNTLKRTISNSHSVLMMLALAKHFVWVFWVYFKDPELLKHDETWFGCRN